MMRSDIGACVCMLRMCRVHANYLKYGKGACCPLLLSQEVE